MKKQLTIVLCLLLASSISFAQVIDRAQLEVIFHYEMVGNRLNPEVVTDETILLIGERYTAYSSFMNFISDSLRRANPAEFMPQIRHADGRPIRPGETITGGIRSDPPRTALPTNRFNTSSIFINRTSGQVTVMDRIMVLDQVSLRPVYFIYTEILESPIWEFHMESDEIAGYVSQKATTRFGGRDWTVWFAPEIPINAGPWKLRGLPGLILKAYTADGEFTKTAISVSRSNRPIAKDEENIYRNTTKQEFFQRQTEAFRNVLVPRSGLNVHHSFTGSGGAMTTSSMEFNHIEILD